MKPKVKMRFIDLEDEVFSIKNEHMHRGTWWYWFWLFFFDNPKNPEKTRQLMILWSSKNEKDFECNGLKLNMDNPKKGNNLNGVVASWYFDGEKMHHNFLLEQCKIKFMKRLLKSDSTIPTSFSVNKNLSKIKIGKDFEFVAKTITKNEFSKPTHEIINYIETKEYSLIEAKHLKLTGRIKNRPVHGSAYFNRVFYSLPYPSWYWGIFHFKNGSGLTYFDYMFKKSLKKGIAFFDGRETHNFYNISVKMIGKNKPSFKVSGEGPKEKINFTVKSYSHAAWVFRKKYLGIFPNIMTYNEYPAIISDLKLVNKYTGKKIVLKDLGRSVGNAEHAEGLLL